MGACLLLMREQEAEGSDDDEEEEDYLCAVALRLLLQHQQQARPHSAQSNRSITYCFTPTPIYFLSLAHPTPPHHSTKRGGPDGGPGAYPRRP